MSMILYGKNVIREVAKTKQMLSLLVDPKCVDDPIVKATKSVGIPVSVKPKDELSRIAKSPDHQGFVATVADFKMYSLKETIDLASNKENPLFLMLDGIEDPHNMGAIIRSADAFGVDAIIIKTRNEAPINATVAKVSTGAIVHSRIVPVTNLTKALDTLKESGYWVVASDGSGKQDFDEVDYKGKIVLIVGSEGFGISRLVLANSDFIVKIPMCGHVNSLNASVATGILLSGVALGRRNSKN